MSSGRTLKLWLLLLAASVGGLGLRAQNWEAALADMPLRQPAQLLNRSNCVDVMLGAFTSNATVKAIVFMPGATDEIYFFRRIKAQLANRQPTLLDAVQALTSQSEIRATFQPPLLLLHTAEDTLEPLINIEHPATFERLNAARFTSHVRYNDRNWDDIYPDLRRLKVSLFPGRDTAGSRHFFRPSLAAWNLTGLEAVRAIALASKTGVAIQRKRLVFTPDRRKEKPSRMEVMPPGTRPAIRDPE